MIPNESWRRIVISWNNARPQIYRHLADRCSGWRKNSVIEGYLWLVAKLANADPAVGCGKVERVKEDSVDYIDALFADLMGVAVSYFVDVYFPPGLPIDRDEIEDELSEIAGLEVVGAGAGETGSNLDLEISSGVSADDALQQVSEVLERLGVAGGVRISVSEE